MGWGGTLDHSDALARPRAPVGITAMSDPEPYRRTKLGTVHEWAINIINALAVILLAILASVIITRA